MDDDSIGPAGHECAQETFPLPRRGDRAVRNTVVERYEQVSIVADEGKSSET